MRGLSDFDQDEPPADGGHPVSEVTIGDGIEAEEIAVAVRQGASEAGLDGQVVSLYVLEGELVVGEVRAIEGTWVQLDAGESHAIGGDARYLEVRTPSS
jgi:hypothetical protein